MKLIAALAVLLSGIPAFASATLTVASPVLPSQTAAYVELDLTNCPVGTIVNSATPVPTTQRFYFNGAVSVTFTVPDNVTQIVCTVATQINGVPNLLSTYTVSYVYQGTSTPLKTIELPPGTFNLANLANVPGTPYAPGAAVGPVGPTGTGAGAIVYADPSVPTQTSITQLGSIGGIVYFPPSATPYSCPTSIPSGVHLVSLGNAYPPADPPTFPAATAQVIFNCTSSLVISDVQGISIEGIQFNFNNAGNLSLIGVSSGEFAFSVTAVDPTKPAVILGADQTQSYYNSTHNNFRYLATNGGSTGIQIGDMATASTKGFFTLNRFYRVTVIANAIPASGTFQTINFIGNCDTLIFDEVHFFGTSAMNAWNGLVLGGSTVADTDADGIEVLWYDETVPNAQAIARTSSGTYPVVVNYSSNNYVKTTVLGWDANFVPQPHYTAAKGLIEYHGQGDGLPQYASQFMNIPGITLDGGPNTTATPGLSWAAGGVPNYLNYMGGDMMLHWYTPAAGANIMTLEPTGNLDLAGVFVNPNGSLFGNTSAQHTAIDLNGVITVSNGSVIQSQFGSGYANFASTTTLTAFGPAVFDGSSDFYMQPTFHSGISVLGGGQFVGNYVFNPGGTGTPNEVQISPGLLNTGSSVNVNFFGPVKLPQLASTGTQCLQIDNTGLVGGTGTTCGSGSGGGGTVTSVAATGANGITVSGSPITSSGTIALGLGAITPTSVTATGAVQGSTVTATTSLTVGTGSGSAASVKTGISSNTDLNGQLTMASGTISRTFTSTYTSAPICVASDTTAIAAVKVAVTTTTLTITGTSADVVNYICIGRN